MIRRSTTFIKARKISPEKAGRVRDMIEAIEEIKAIEAGRRKPRTMKSLLREL